MGPIGDILFLAGKAAVKAVTDWVRAPRRVANRSPRAVFFCHFLQLLLGASKQQSIVWLRRRQNLLRSWSPRQREAHFQSCVIEAVPCLWCRHRDHEASGAEPIVVYFHGGGYVIGSVQGYRNVLAHIAVESNALVLAVDYRLAPEHRFPAAHQDCMAVARKVLLDYPGSPVFLAGDSAGGALALATALALADETEVPPLAGLALLSPWVEPANADDSMGREAPFDMLDQALLQRWIDLYLSGEDPRHPWVDFSAADFRQLPPTHLQFCEREVLFDQCCSFAERARVQGVDLSMEIFPGQFHVFQIFAPLLPGSAAALAAIGRFIRKAAVRQGRSAVNVRGSSPDASP